MNTRNCTMIKSTVVTTVNRYQILLSLGFEELHHLTEENEQGRRESIREAGR